MHDHPPAINHNHSADFRLICAGWSDAFVTGL